MINREAHRHDALSSCAKICLTHMIIIVSVKNAKSIFY